eukprot:662474-Pyramimonas_sp.AAC.1
MACCFSSRAAATAKQARPSSALEAASCCSRSLTALSSRLMAGRSRCEGVRSGGAGGFGSTVAAASRRARQLASPTSVFAALTSDMM